MTPGGPQGGYKLILVPEGVIVQDEDDRKAGQARILVAAAGIGAGWPGAAVGPFEVAADVGPDRRITMSGEGKTARLVIQCAGSVILDGQPAGRLDYWAYEHLASLALPFPEYEYGDSLVFEMRLAEVDP